MVSPFPARSVALLAATVAGTAEVWLTIRADLDPIYALPLAIATGATMIWTCLALDALIRRRARPDRADIAGVRDLQYDNRAMIDDHARRLVRVEAVLAFLAAQSELEEADRRLTAAAAAVETWDALPATLPVWYEARRIWTELVERLVPGCTAGADMPSADQLHAARDKLPITQNFSSEELKAAILYLTQAEHIIAVRQSLITLVQGQVS